MRARFAPSQAALDGSEEAAGADECWLTGHTCVRWRGAIEDARYGALTNNSSGNETFHKDRAVWYEHVTGDSLDGLSASLSRESASIVDVIERLQIRASLIRLKDRGI